MTIIDGEFVPEDTETIEQRIRNNLRNQFGNDVDLTEGSIFATLARAYAEVLSGEIQQDLQDVFDSSFLESATGENLEKLVAIIGLERLSALRATGTVTFQRDSRETNDITIPQGTSVETGGSNPITYDTTESRTIEFHDSFEGGTYPSDWSGSTGQFERDTVFASDGTHSLRCPGGLGGSITYDGSVFRRGDTVSCDMYLEDGGSTPDVGELGFMAQTVGDVKSGYRASLNADQVELQLWKTNGNKVASAVPSGVANLYDATYTVEVNTFTRGLIVVNLYDANGDKIADISYNESLDSNSIREGPIGLRSLNGEANFDFIADTAVTSNIRAVNAGADGNVGSGRITQMTSPISGIDDLFNVPAVGNTDVTDADGTPLTSGTDEETDSQLRQRARQVTGTGGAASVNELLSAVTSIQAVTSVTIFTNPTDTSNNGLPPVSFEMVVNGGDSYEVAEAVFETQAATARDVSGVNGTTVSESIEAVNGQTFTTEFSRPTEVDVDMTLDIVHTDEYEGDVALRNAIIDYVGGVDTDGSPVVGTDVGEDVRIDEIEDIVMDIGGVKGIADGGTSYTPTTTTNGNGLVVIDVASNEVARTNGSDGSIVITKTEV